jgi:aspartyl-tRNA(Asn)/glutamyl-tRNA(Gln) amidotransferase subunit A
VRKALLWQLSAVEQAAGVRDGRWSAEMLTTAVLERVADVNPKLNAYVTMNDQALDEARAADRRQAAGEPTGPLHGVPFSVKDLIPTKGLRTTLGSLAHQDWVPDQDEISVARLRDAGGILIGKTNTRELGYGIVTDNELFGPTRNPWDVGMTAAGSSGGAAAAVAAGMGSIALGSDGGGSLRVPAAICGVFALKPTFGAVPLYPSSRLPLRTGLNSWESLECIGPITRTVADGALVMSVIAGLDVRDRHSVPLDTELRTSRQRDLVLTYSPSLAGAEVDSEVAEIVEAAVKAVASRQSWIVREASPQLPALADLREIFAATVAMDTDLEELRKLAEHVTVSPDIRELVDRQWSGDELTRARRNRQIVYDTMRRFGELHDVLLTPTTATAAFPVGMRFPQDADCGIADGRQWSPFAFLSNLTGQPSVSIPVGLTRTGLPVGVQVSGRHFADDLLLDVAKAFEQVHPWEHSFHHGGPE